MRLFFLFLIVVSALNFPLSAGSVGMTSENYQIESTAISVGGDLTTSTNYQTFGVIGETDGAEKATSSSSNYIVYPGFLAMASTTYVTASLSASSVSLGSLSASAVSSASQILTINTNAPTGYTATIQEDGNLRSGSDDINDVADGSVTAGSEEYGIRTSGSAGQMNSADTAITGAAQTVASASTAVVGQQTTITYKTAVGSATASGNYSHTVTFTTTVNY